MEQICNGVKLTCDDCFSLIPTLEDKSVDLVIADPPYKLGSCAGGGLYKPIKGNDEANPYKRKETNSVLELKKLGCAEFEPVKFLDLITPKMKKFYGYFFCNKPLLPDYLNYAVSHKYLFEIIILYKQAPIPARNNHFLPDTEYCVMIRDTGTYFAKDAKFDDYRKLYTVSNWKKIHPAEKPVELIERFVRVSCPENGLILDPFMGSGTTGIAAMQNGRNFCGIEKDAAVYELAKNRIKRLSDEQNGVGSLFENGFY